jgi:hypothetical protein
MYKMLALLQMDWLSANSFGEERNKRAISSMMCDIGAVVVVAKKPMLLYGTCGYGYIEHG